MEAFGVLEASPSDSRRSESVSAAKWAMAAQGRCSAEDGDQAQREQRVQAVAAAPDPAWIGYLTQDLGQGSELRWFRIRAGGVDVLAVAHRSGRMARERDPCS